MLFNDFSRYLKKFENVVHVAIELSAGKDIITSVHNPYYFQIKGVDKIWYKENLINIAVNALSTEAKYIAWIDADLIFTRQDWVDAAIKELQSCPIIQLWSTGISLGSDHQRIYNDVISFAHSLTIDDRFKAELISITDESKKVSIGHPGYGWACTREWFNTVGGLPDFCIAGSADSYIARAVIGRIEDSIYSGMSESWSELLVDFQNRCQDFYKTDRINYVKNMVIHYWHGSMENRQYKTRKNILLKHRYDPVHHLIKDAAGLNHFVNVPVEFRQDLEMYFLARNEDCDDI